MNTAHLSNALRILGLLLMPFSLSMLTPLLVAWWYHENTFSVFLGSTLITFFLGLFIWFPFRHTIRELYARDGFLIVFLLWCALSIMGSLPFLISNHPNILVIDAIFETVSALTTTGASVFTNLDGLPRSLLYYRQQLQFIGGGGIILLGIAIYPMLGVGGMQLFRAEMAGSFKEEKLTPRIAETAKTLWLIYVGLVALCAFSFWLGGMDLFDAIGHSFGTISTGGFSTRDANFGFFHSPLLDVFAIIFMIAGAANFSLHFIALQRGGLQQYWQDPEFKAYIMTLLIGTTLVSVTLFYYHTYQNTGTTLLKSLFHVTSLMTTTGYTTSNLSNWPTFTPFLLMFISIIGGCSGSTTGGIKMVRLLILRKHSVREILRLIHPKGHYVIKLGNSVLHHRTLEAILGFFYLYVITFVILLLALLATDLDFLSAFSGLVTTLSNSGIGLGRVYDNFQSIDTSAKTIMCFAMFAGRLEFFSLLVLLAPAYWRN